MDPKTQLSNYLGQLVALTSLCGMLFLLPSFQPYVRLFNGNSNLCFMVTVFLSLFIAIILGKLVSLLGRFIG